MIIKKYYYISLIIFSAYSAFASDWPCFGGDKNHSFVSSEIISSKMYLQWSYTASKKPAPAWPEPARQDFWHNVGIITPAVTYDRAFDPVIADGKLYFGSSADDSIRCLNAETGKLIWKFYTEGPVRLAPVIHENKIYFGSDDGCVYCLNDEDGSIIWKKRCSREDYRIAGNERIISLWPVRTGVFINNEILYTTSGIFPNQGVFVKALDADTGKNIWTEKAEISPQGYIAVMRDKLVIPGSRTEPGLFDIKTGQFDRKIEGAGGAFTLVVENMVVNAPGRREGKISVFDNTCNTSIASFDGIRMIVRGPKAYLLSHNDITAINREKYNELCQAVANLKKKSDQLEKNAKTEKDKEKLHKIKLRIDYLDSQKQYCIEWKQVLPRAYSMLLTTDKLITGCENKVVALSVDDGKKVWQHEVNGSAYCLAAADGSIFVSTDEGVIYCFASEKKCSPCIITESENLNTANDKNVDKIAEKIINTTEIDKGYCLVTDLYSSELIKALAQKSQLKIIAVSNDKDLIDSCTNSLNMAGLYGKAVVIFAEPDRLPFADYLFNLAISEKSVLTGEKPKVKIEQIYSKLRPCGGTYYHLANDNNKQLENFATEVAAKIKKTDSSFLLLRPALPDVGQWTQLYADPGHTACSSDPARGPFRIQWFGKPGPRNIIDRHHRPMSSLYSDGRLIVPADEAVVAVDAYNGTMLWKKNVPGSRRVAALKNCGHMLINEKNLYIATGQNCCVYNIKDAGKIKTFKIPGDSNSKDWGYLNFYDNMLIGSIQKKNASFSDLAFSNSPLNGSKLMEGDFKEVVISQSIFAINTDTGNNAWFRDFGSVMNNAITVHKGKIFFAHSADTQLRKDSDARVRIDHFCDKGMKISAVDINSGKIIWQKPCKLPYQHIMFLNAAKHVLLISGTYNKKNSLYYEMFALDIENGSELWNNQFLGMNIRATGPSPLDGTHGEQWQHPVINKNTIYLRPYAFDLSTGQKIDYIARRGGHGCGGFTASANYLFGRGDNPRAYPLDINQTEGDTLTACTRPGCWLNIIPAGGLVMIPESSSGCTCGYALQTSVVFAPSNN